MASNNPFQPELFLLNGQWYRAIENPAAQAYNAQTIPQYYTGNAQHNVVMLQIPQPHPYGTQQQLSLQPNSQTPNPTRGRGSGRGSGRGHGRGRVGRGGRDRGRGGHGATPGPGASNVLAPHPSGGIRRSIYPGGHDEELRQRFAAREASIRQQRVRNRAMNSNSTSSPNSTNNQSPENDPTNGQSSLDSIAAAVQAGVQAGVESGVRAVMQELRSTAAFMTAGVAGATPGFANAQVNFQQVPQLALPGPRVVDVTGSDPNNSNDVDLIDVNGAMPDALD